MAAFKTRVRIKGTGLYIAPPSERMDGAAALLSPSVSSRPAYAAAGGGYRSAGWWPSQRGPNAAHASLATLRARAMDADRNTPFAGSAHDKIAQQIVGTGIKPQSLCPHTPTRKAINALFEDWTDESDADGIFDFYGQQHIAARSAAAQGEMFARFRYRQPGDMTTVPLQVQLLEADFVPVEFAPAGGLAPGNEVRAGIELDIIGRRVAYWMHRIHPHDPAGFGTRYRDSTPVRVPADQIAHIYLPTRIGQLRGYPWLSRVLTALRDLSEYTDDERVRKKTAAMFAGYIESADDETDDPASGSSTVEGDDDVIVLDPGTMHRLKPGEKVSFSQPTEVGGSFDPFLKWGWREVSSGIGLLYEMLTGDYSNLNDRTLRAAANDFRRGAEGWQHHMMVFQFCRQLWRRWLRAAELNERIVRPAGMSDLDFFRVRWVPQAWPYLNPWQDVQTKEKEIQAGLKSRTGVVAAGGDDIEAIDAETAGDNARADRHKNVYTSDGRVAAKKSSAPSAKADGGATGSDPAEGGPDTPDGDEDDPADPDTPPANNSQRPEPDVHA